MKKIAALLASLILLSGCTLISSNESDEPAESRQERRISTDDRIDNDAEVVADNLDVPWSIQQEGDTFYLSERSGIIAKVSNGQVEHQPVSLKEELSSASEAGLLGFVLAPNFSDEQEAYAYYTYEKDDKIFNRIIRLELDEGKWQETAMLLDEIPSGTHHHGGRLAFGPDGKLYATTGDASEPEIAQDRESLGGKILRLNLDGSIPEDNPFSESYVYSYGHRNPQGLAWNQAGQLYASEHGASSNDEINQIEAGKNYGWPLIEGNEEQTGLESPIFTSGNDQTWAPSGMTYHENKLYTAALRGTAILVFDLESNAMERLLSGYGRIRDVYQDGEMLYFITNNRDGRGTPQENDDKLYRIQLN